MQTFHSDFKKAVQEELSGQVITLKKAFSGCPEYLQAYEDLAEAMLDFIIVGIEPERAVQLWELSIKLVSQKYAKVMVKIFSELL